MIWRTEQDKTRLYVVEAVEEKNNKKKTCPGRLGLARKKDDWSANFMTLFAKIKKHKGISLKTRSMLKLFRSVIRNIVTNSKFAIRPAELLMELKVSSKTYYLRNWWNENRTGYRIIFRIAHLRSTDTKRKTK